MSLESFKKPRIQACWILAKLWIYQDPQSPSPFPDDEDLAQETAFNVKNFFGTAHLESAHLCLSSKIESRNFHANREVKVFLFHFPKKATKTFTNVDQVIEFQCGSVPCRLQFLDKSYAGQKNIPRCFMEDYGQARYFKENSECYILEKNGYKELLEQMQEAETDSDSEIVNVKMEICSTRVLKAVQVKEVPPSMNEVERLKERLENLEEVFFTMKKGFEKKLAEVEKQNGQLHQEIAGLKNELGSIHKNENKQNQDSNAFPKRNFEFYAQINFQQGSKKQEFQAGDIEPFDAKKKMKLNDVGATSSSTNKKSN